ncbi:unnamed protein product, partial [Owenia fusiformis]
MARRIPDITPPSWLRDYQQQSSNRGALLETPDQPLMDIDDHQDDALLPTPYQERHGLLPTPMDSDPYDEYHYPGQGQGRYPRGYETDSYRHHTEMDYRRYREAYPQSARPTEGKLQSWLQRNLVNRISSQSEHSGYGQNRYRNQRECDYDRTYTEDNDPYRPAVVSSNTPWDDTESDERNSGNVRVIDKTDTNPRNKPLHVTPNKPWVTANEVDPLKVSEEQDFDPHSNWQSDENYANLNRPTGPYMNNDQTWSTKNEPVYASSEKPWVQTAPKEKSSGAFNPLVAAAANILAKFPKPSKPPTPQRAESTTTDPATSQSTGAADNTQESTESLIPLMLGGKKDKTNAHDDNTDFENSVTDSTVTLESTIAETIDMDRSRSNSPMVQIHLKDGRFVVNKENGSNKSGTTSDQASHTESQKDNDPNVMADLQKQIAAQLAILTGQVPISLDSPSQVDKTGISENQVGIKSGSPVKSESPVSSGGGSPNTKDDEVLKVEGLDIATHASFLDTLSGSVPPKDRANPMSDKALPNEQSTGQSSTVADIPLPEDSSLSRQSTPTKKPSIAKQTSPFKPADVLKQIEVLKKQVTENSGANAEETKKQISQLKKKVAENLKQLVQQAQMKLVKPESETVDKKEEKLRNEVKKHHSEKSKHHSKRHEEKHSRSHRSKDSQEREREKHKEREARRREKEKHMKEKEKHMKEKEKESHKSDEKQTEEKIDDDNAEHIEDGEIFDTPPREVTSPEIMNHPLSTHNTTQGSNSVTANLTNKPGIQIQLMDGKFIVNKESSSSEVHKSTKLDVNNKKQMMNDDLNQSPVAFSGQTAASNDPRKAFYDKSPSRIPSLMAHVQPPLMPHELLSPDVKTAFKLSMNQSASNVKPLMGEQEKLSSIKPLMSQPVKQQDPRRSFYKIAKDPRTVGIDQSKMHISAQSDLYSAKDVTNKVNEPHKTYLPKPGDTPYNGPATLPHSQQNRALLTMVPRNIRVKSDSPKPKTLGLKSNTAASDKDTDIRSQNQNLIALTPSGNASIELPTNSADSNVQGSQKSTHNMQRNIDSKQEQGHSNFSHDVDMRVPLLPTPPPANKVLIDIKLDDTDFTVDYTEKIPGIKTQKSSRWDVKTREIGQSPRDIVSPRQIQTSPRDVPGSSPRSVLSSPRDSISSPRDVSNSPIGLSPRDTPSSPREAQHSPRGEPISVVSQKRPDVSMQKKAHDIWTKGAYMPVQPSSILKKTPSNFSEEAKNVPYTNNSFKKPSFKKPENSYNVKPNNVKPVKPPVTDLNKQTTYSTQRINAENMKKMMVLSSKKESSGKSLDIQTKEKKGSSKPITSKMMSSPNIDNVSHPLGKYSIPKKYKPPQHDMKMPDKESVASFKIPKKNKAEEQQQTAFAKPAKSDKKDPADDLKKLESKTNLKVKIEKKSDAVHKVESNRKREKAKRDEEEKEKKLHKVKQEETKHSEKKVDDSNKGTKQSHQSEKQFKTSENLTEKPSKAQEMVKVPKVDASVKTPEILNIKEKENLNGNGSGCGTDMEIDLDDINIGEEIDASDLESAIASSFGDEPKKPKEELPIKCLDCETSFKLQRDLDAHRLKCPKVLEKEKGDKYESIFESVLGKKEITSTSSVKTLVCKLCEYSTKDISVFETHVEHHGCDAPYKCELCNYASERKTAIKLHQTKFHSFKASKYFNSKMKTYDCKECEYTCLRSTNLKTHLRYHNVKGMFRCEVCSFSCEKEGNISLHERKYHKHLIGSDDERDDDNESKKNARSSPRLTHPKGHRQNYLISEKDSDIISGKSKLNEKRKCPVDGCPYLIRMNKKTELTKHLLCHEGRGSYKCSECSYTNDSMISLKLHKRLHIKYGRRYVHESSEDEEEQTKVLHCPNRLCPFVTKLKQSLDVHIRHHNQKFKFRCAKCGFSCTSRSSLYHHQKSHDKLLTDVKEKIMSPVREPVGKIPNAKQCKHCDYESRNQSLLKRHNKFHYRNRKKKHKCVKCSYSSDYKSTVAEHEKLHHIVRIHKSYRSLNKLRFIKKKYDPKNLIKRGCHVLIENIDIELGEKFTNITTNKKLKKLIQQKKIKDKAEDDKEPEKDFEPSIDVDFEDLTQFYCQLCPYNTPNSQFYRRHILHHNIISNHTCHVCSYSSNDFDALKRHVEWHNEKSLLIENKTTYVQRFEYNCSLCGYKSNSGKAFMYHKECHSYKYHYRCHLCSYSNDLALRVQYHFKRHHTFPELEQSDHMLNEAVQKRDLKPRFINKGPDFVRCAFCPYKTGVIENLERHLQFHKQNTQYRCSYCSYSSVKQETLNKHVRLHFGTFWESPRSITSLEDIPEPTNTGLYRIREFIPAKPKPIITQEEPIEKENIVNMEVDGPMKTEEGHFDQCESELEAVSTADDADGEESLSTSDCESVAKPNLTTLTGTNQKTYSGLNMFDSIKKYSTMQSSDSFSESETEGKGSQCIKLTSSGIETVVSNIIDKLITDDETNEPEMEH